MANKMKAVVYRKYGPPNKVLEIKEVDKPAPEEDEIQVKVHAAAVNFSDWTFVRGVPFMVRMMFSGLLKPKYPILGADIAGLVDVVGKNVTLFQPGDNNVVYAVSIDDRPILHSKKPPRYHRRHSSPCRVSAMKDG